jgi:uncharacterized repeat protein (TIGR01451 family)
VTQTPGLSIVKRANHTSVDAVGETIIYTFTVTNTGNVTLTSVSVDDSQVSPAVSLATGPTCASLASPNASCSGSTATLKSGQVATFTATYITTQADLDHGSVEDSASATGDPPSGPPTTTPTPSTVTVPVRQNPSITILTTAGLAYYSKAGEVIPYAFLVTNTGNVTLHGVSVTSELVGLSHITCPTTTLAPNHNMTCTATYQTTKANVKKGSVANVATASGHSPTDSRVKSRPSGVVVPAIRKTVPVTG